MTAVYADGNALPCFICDKVLPNISDTVINQPSGGTAFITYGHYGSTVFDPMNNTFLEITICDDCYHEKATKFKVLRGREYKKQSYEAFYEISDEDLPIEVENG